MLDFRAHFYQNSWFFPYLEEKNYQTSNFLSLSQNGNYHLSLI